MSYREKMEKKIPQGKKTVSLNNHRTIRTLLGGEI